LIYIITLIVPEVPTEVVDVKVPEVAKAAYEVSNYLGYFNIDYFGGNFRHDEGNDVYQKIKDSTGLEKFDIVFYLSCQQLLMPDYLKAICADHFILEGHSGQHEETFSDILNSSFDEVKYLGKSTDHGSRPVFHCRKAKTI
jgi:hypothetical protein